MLNSSIVISPLVLFCFQGRLIKQFGELITFFCQFKCLLALAPFAILQKIRYTDQKGEEAIRNLALKADFQKIAKKQTMQLLESLFKGAKQKVIFQWQKENSES